MNDTADRDDLAAILAKHTITRYSYNGGRNAECVCSCDETVCRNSEQDTPHDDRHRAHVAQMVLESDWLRGVRAKELRDAAAAWNQGQWSRHYGIPKQSAPAVENWLRDRADRVDAEDGGR